MTDVFYWRPAPEHPACWEWPISDGVRAAAAAATDFTGDSVLAEWQAGRCAVCADTLEVLDHDHQTGSIRGWLCRSCNNREWRWRTGVFQEYRERSPAVILGIVARYWSPLTGWAEPTPPVEYDMWRDNPMRGIGL